MGADEIQSKNVTIETSQWVAVCQLPSYHRHIHSLFEEMIHRRWGHTHWHPAVDIIETADAFIVQADLPGVDPDTTTVNVAGQTLTIDGQRKIDLDELCPVCVHTTERPMGKFHYKADFPGPLDSSHMGLTHKNGVLTIRIPKLDNKGHKQ